MKMKKLIFFTAVLAAFMFSVIPVQAAHADMGPKPSVVIDFAGLEGKEYYVTLLSEKNSTGPFSSTDFGGEHYNEGDEDYDIFLKFAEYEDFDGYFFLQYFKNCSESQKFSWTYYPPYKFKILMYFPESDSFLASSQVLERYAFDSYFSATVKDGNIESVEKSYNYSGESMSLAARIVLTIIAELALALLFGFRSKKQFALIAAVNAITQITLNIVLNIIKYNMGALAFIFYFVLLEFVVFVAEAIVFSVFLKKLGGKPFPEWKPTVYALASNAASFTLGLWLAKIIPGIF